MIIVYTDAGPNPFFPAALELFQSKGLPAVLMHTANFHSQDLFIPDFLSRECRGLLLDGIAVSQRFPFSVLEKWMEQFPDKPVVLVNRHHPGIASVIPGDEKAFEELTLHFLDEHHCQNPIFLGGPSTNQASKRRQRGFEKALNSRGFESEGRIRNGAFSPDGGCAQAEEIIRSNESPDALLIATDSQALGLRKAYAVAGRIPPPHSGHDNRPEVIPSMPDLTSIHMDEGFMAHRGAAVLADWILSGRPSEEKIIQVPLPVVYRKSCGCQPRSGQKPSGAPWDEFFPIHAEREAAQEAMEAWAKGDPSWKEKWVRWTQPRQNDSLFFRRALSAFYFFSSGLRVEGAEEAERLLMSGETERGQILSFVERQTYYWMHPVLEKLGAHPNPGDPEETEKLLTQFLPQKGISHIRLWTLEKKGFEVEARTFTQKYANEKGGVMVHTLMGRGSPIALLSWAPSTPLYGAEEVLIHALSSQIMVHQAFRREEQARLRLMDAVDLLEQHNLSLKEASETDSLTGLLNRRGFLSRVRPLWQKALDRGRSALFVFGDLDGLKKINDGNGHEAGDLAILSAGQCLVQCLRKTDLVARLGGDEFVALLLGVDERAMPIIHRRVEHWLGEWNRSHLLPWTLGISLGACARPDIPGVSLEQHLAAADRHLYEVKKTRKKIRDD